MENKIKIFENKQVRTLWNADEEEWYFSVVDVVGILSESKIPRNYWSDLKRKLKQEGSELHEKIVQLKMQSTDKTQSQPMIICHRLIFTLVSSTVNTKKDFYKNFRTNT